MGSNGNGKLGIDNLSLPYSSIPCLVETLNSYIITKVSCGWTHTAAINGFLPIITNR